MHLIHIDQDTCEGKKAFLKRTFFKGISVADLVLFTSLIHVAHVANTQSRINVNIEPL
jgi:hypothetical protein